MKLKVSLEDRDFFLDFNPEIGTKINLIYAGGKPDFIYQVIYP